jgi:hypothetical protein
MSLNRALPDLLPVMIASPGLAAKGSAVAAAGSLPLPI